ncbi:hypothetical protein PGQ11_009360 [Apiospora arundinis]|uniref:RNase H type-1 domain-containing protein n=1 Tax=Apiospora arundinis TaxID=335852 RepID=A0ABR2IHR5_9PEZI
MFTDGSARSHLGPDVPRTSAVTYRCIYDESGARNAPWVDLSYGAIGITTSDEAEIVAMAQALKALEQELRGYVDSKNSESGRAAPGLRVMVFSDSQACLGILFRMIHALRRNMPYTGRDWVVEYLKDNLQIVAELIYASPTLDVWVEFHWIKGHSLIEGNDRADWLAYEAFPKACLYFSAYNLPVGPAMREIASMERMSKVIEEAKKEGDTESGEYWAGMADLEFAMESESHAVNACGQVVPSSGMLKEMEENLRREIWEAVKELKKDSLVSAIPVEGPVVADLGSEPRKQRKRDVVAAKLRHAGKRFREGFPAKLSRLS